jgi:hypothetical protein
MPKGTGIMELIDFEKWNQQIQHVRSMNRIRLMNRDHIMQSLLQVKPVMSRKLYVQANPHCLYNGFNPVIRPAHGTKDHHDSKHNPDIRIG